MTTAAEQKAGQLRERLYKAALDGVDEHLAFDLREAADEAEDLLDDAPTGVADELRDLAAKARARADRLDTPDAALRARRVDLFAAIRDADREPPWRVERFVADGFVTVLAGRGGEGKSLWAQGLAGAVQQGATVAGFPCRQGRVAIFDAENGMPLIGRRLKQADTPIDDLVIYEADGLDLARDREAIEHAIRDEAAQLVVFDSLRTLAPRARENDSDDMAPIMGALRQIARGTGAGVLLLHHRDKALDHDFRGSGAIHDQVDVVFVLERDPKDPENRWRRRLRCAKCRIDAEPADRWIGIKHWRGSLTLTEAAPHNPDADRPAPQRDELADRALDVLSAADEPLTRAELARRLDRSRTDGTLRRALDTLTETGHAHRDPDGRWGVPPTPTAPHPAAPTHDPSNHAANRGATEGNGTPDHTDTPRAKAPPPPEGGAPDGTPGNGTPDDLVDQMVATFDATEEPT